MDPAETKTFPPQLQRSLRTTSARCADRSTSMMEPPLVSTISSDFVLKVKSERVGNVQPPNTGHIASVHRVQSNHLAESTAMLLTKSSSVDACTIPQEHSISSLVQSLHPRPDNLMDPTIRAIWSLVLKNDVTRDELIHEGAIPQLVFILRQGSEDQQEIAADILTLLCGSTKHCEVIANAEAINPLISCVQSNKRSLAESAVYALSALAENSSAIASDIVFAGAIPLFVTLFRSKFDYAVYALEKFASMNEANATAIAHHGAIASFAALLDHGTKYQQEAARKALHQITLASDVHQSEIQNEKLPPSAVEPLETSVSKVLQTKPPLNRKVSKSVVRHRLRRLSRVLDSSHL